MDRWSLIYALITGLVIYAALVDLRTRRVPNALTAPLLVAGALVHAWAWTEDFPTALLMALGLFVAWGYGLMGGGDAKLWMALIFWTPPYEFRPQLFGAVMVATAVSQMAWRYVRRRTAVGVRAPAAWRAVPYAGIVLALAMTGGVP